MTRTEEWLVDALQARADAVRTDRLRPLTESMAEPRLSAGRRQRFAPLAAAAAMVLVAVALVVVASIRQAPRTGQPAASAPTAAPRFYAEDSGRRIVVRSVATGKAIASVTVPPDVYAQGLAAGPDGRTFYMNTDWGPGSKTPSSIYQFRISASGKATPLRPVRGGRIDAGLMLNGLTVSPDGTHVAIVASRPIVFATNATIVVIDVRTGVRRMWSGGLRRSIHNNGLVIWGLSWSGAQTLEFMTTWCSNSIWAYCGPGTAQVRELNVSSAGGSLAASTVLPVDLARFPRIAGMVADQQGNLDILEVAGNGEPVGSRTTVTVWQLSSATGAVTRVLYRHDMVVEANLYAVLAADPSGQHLLLWLNDSVHGWLDHGIVRQLRIGSIPWPITW